MIPKVGDKFVIKIPFFSFDVVGDVLTVAEFEEPSGMYASNPKSNRIYPGHNPLWRYSADNVTTVLNSPLYKALS
jgi:hypothetical protein